MNSTVSYGFNDETATYDPQFAEKLDHSLTLIRGAHWQLGDRLVVEHNLTRESCVVWDLAKRASQGIRGFCIATRFQPPEAVTFMEQLVAQYPEIRIYESYMQIPDELPDIDPELCCRVLRNGPKRQALKEMNISCLMTEFCNTHNSRLVLSEFQQIAAQLSELTPILTWNDSDIARYVEARQIRFSPVCQQDVRKIGCSACHREVLRGRTFDKVGQVIRAQAQKIVLSRSQYFPMTG
jgi:3'-phosphoadenosine 5'-phosphosulfate sulfotransferase (PAPS reductase)/FAD synthetase